MDETDSKRRYGPDHEVNIRSRGLRFFHGERIDCLASVVQGHSDQ